MNNTTFREILFFTSWPDIRINKNVSEFQIFSNYYDQINKEDILNKMRTQVLKNQGEKDLTEAKQFRMIGNKLYKDEEYEEALSNYNESISLAPRDSTEFGLAVANRSAVFFSMEKYKECLEDINLVLKTEYPKDLLYKIFLRQAKCNFKLNLKSDVTKSLNRAQESIKDLKLSKAQRKLINVNIMAVKSELKHLKSDVSNTEPYEIKIPEANLKGGENSKFLNASEVVTFKYTRKLGRHVVASTDIKMGDVLFIEEPYSYVPVYEKLHKYTICAFCLQKCLNCIPCLSCTVFLYCSDDCRQKAWDLEGHCWDCLGKRRGIIMNDELHACLNMLFNATRDGFETKVNDESVYGNQVNNYPFVSKLLTNKSKMNETEIQKVVKWAVWLVLYLKNYTDYFDRLYLQLNRPEGSKDDLIKIIGGQLVKYFMQIMCNVVHIQQTRVRLDPEDFAVLKFSIIGLGLYLSSALLNHSCIPNCTDSFCGTKRVIKASKDIKKGTEVTINYLTVDDNPIDDEDILLNKAEMKRFRFDCSCRKCTDPNYEKLLNAYLCPRCSGKALLTENVSAKCVECNFEFNAFGYMMIEKQLIELDFLVNIAGDYTQLDTMYNLMKKIYNKHNNKFIAYYFACMQYYNRNGDMRNCMNKSRLKLNLYGKVYEHMGMHLGYALTNLVHTYVLAKYCKTLRRQNSAHYEKYFDETKEMIKKCGEVLEFFTCAHIIVQFVKDMTGFLMTDDDIDIDDDGFVLEELE